MTTENNKYAPVPGKIPGTLINLSGVCLVLAPLNLDQVKANEELLANLGKNEKGGPLNAKQGMEQAVPFVHASLARNYPDITESDVCRLIDVGNFHAAIAAVISISGYATTPDEEAAKQSGEKLSGMTSTPT